MKNVQQFFWVSLLIWVATGVLSCKDHGQSGMAGSQAPPAGLLPLAVGRQWSYVTTTYDSLGEAVATFNARTVVVGDTTVGGEKWYTLEDNAVQRMNTTNRRDGIYALGDDGEATLIYKYPAGVGDECPPYTVTSIDTVVSCGAGQYTCYRYHYTSSGSTGERRWTITVDDFISPGVGLVKHEVKKLWDDGGSAATSGGMEITELMER